MNKPVDPKVDGFIRYRMDLGYDGTDFNGWAKQPNLRTVQKEVVKALSMIFGETKDDFQLRIAGRTDAGVHAVHQVAHFELTEMQIKRIGRNQDLWGRLNSLLPRDIRIHEIGPAPRGFDARYSAVFRRYRYRISDLKALRDPMFARYTLWLRAELNLAQMRAAAKVLIGLHDFAAFCKPRVGGTTIRRLRHIKISRNPELGNIVEIELKADAFCHNMVRSIVGALIAVGRGKASVQDLQDRLKSGSRAQSFKVVAPEGLALIEVGYPTLTKLGSQAEKSRSLRSLDEN
jgi:tRNA pseudouridine38-40 synthase